MISFNRKKILYVTDGSDWVLNEIALSLKKEIEKKKKIFDIIKFDEAEKKKNKLYHYTSIYNLDEVLKQLNQKSKRGFTFFHIATEHLPHLKKLSENQKLIDFVHTSCEITMNNLIKGGISENKIIKIPIGIELSQFVSKKTKNEIRSYLEIPQDKFVIGSFQKDGNGWEEGLEPKLIKGPDIFCDAVEKLNQKFPLFVLLTGPARGYVKNRLEKAGIEYMHHNLENYYDIIDYYKALDLYIVSSRIEGGPRAPMEAMAMGIPVVSTKVGQVPELIKSGENGFIADVEDIDEIVNCSQKILQNESLKNNIVNNAYKTVKKYDYSVLADLYCNDIYSRFINI